MLLQKPQYVFHPNFNLRKLHHEKKHKEFSKDKIPNMDRCVMPARAQVRQSTLVEVWLSV
jgi:hypothetical protein